MLFFTVHGRGGHPGYVTSSFPHPKESSYSVDAVVLYKVFENLVRIICILLDLS